MPFETPTPEPTQHRDFFWSTCIPPKVEEDQKLYQYCWTKMSRHRPAYTFTSSAYAVATTSVPLAIT